MLLFCCRRRNRGRNASQKRQHTQKDDSEDAEELNPEDQEDQEDQVEQNDHVEQEDLQPPVAPAVSRKIGVADTEGSDVRIMFLFFIKENFNDKKAQKVDICYILI